MKMLITACLLMLCCIAQSNQSKIPVPLWTQSLATSISSTTKNHPLKVKAATSHVIMLGNKNVIALTRSTGTLLWERPQQWKSGVGNQSAFGEGKRWSVIGAVQQPQETIVLEAKEDITSPDLDKQRPYIYHYHSVLYGLAALSGRILWKADNGEFDSKSNSGSVMFPLGIYSGLLILADGTRIQAREATTGKLVDLRASKGKEVLEQLTAQNSEAVAFYLGKRTRLATALLTPISSLPGMEAVTKDVTVVRVDEDTDTPGGSLFPKYLVGRDNKSQELWRFPAALTYADQEHGIAASESRITHTVHRENRDVLLAWNDAGTRYGIRIRDGKLLWKSKTPFDFLQSSTFYRSGYFGLVPLSRKNKQAYELAWQEETTGKIILLSALPYSCTLNDYGALWADDNNVLIQSSPNHFVRYSCANLFPRKHTR